MALQPGFDRYEGLAYFGYTRDGEGHDAIVNIGEKFIEIKNAQEQVLSIWAPHSFECNDLEIPMRCYFSGDEWIAPQDKELVDFLDQYLAYETETVTETPPSRPKWHYLSGAAFLMGVVFIIGYIIFQTSISRLIDPSIAARLDQKIMATKFAPMKICDMETEPILRDFLREKAPQPNFKIVKDLGVNFARMPSGLLVIDQQWVSNFSGEDTLIALINLAHISNESNNPAKEMISDLPFWEKFKFLKTGDLPAEQTYIAWDNFKIKPQISMDDIKKIEDPIGNFAELAEIAELPTAVALPSIRAGLDFGDQDWLTLITLCPDEPLG